MRNQETVSNASPRATKPSIVDRLARVAFTFIVMNCSAVVAAVAAMTRRKVWR